MSLRTSRNLGPFTTGPQCIFALKQWLTSGHGGTKFWSVVCSGDGLAAYSSSGDVISHNGTGANGLNNANAWFVLRDPDNNRELLFHRTTQHYNWNLWYLRGQAFDTSGADHDTPATHANKKSWMGSRSATPIVLFPSTVSWYYHVCCEGDTAEGNVYPFWAIARYTTSGLVASTLLMDCVVDALSPAADSDKAILLGEGVQALNPEDGVYLGYGSAVLSRLSGYVRFGEANVEWSHYTMPYYTDYHNNTYPGSIGTHPEDGKYPILPSFYWRVNAVVNGMKGQSKMVTYKASSTMTYGDTIYDGTEYWLVVDKIMLRGWPDSTGPLI